MNKSLSPSTFLMIAATLGSTVLDAAAEENGENSALSASKQIDVGEQFSISEKFKPGDRFMNTRLLGAVRLKPKALRGEKPRELSGLVWDADENVLLAISDDGFIVHLHPQIRDDQLMGLKMSGIYPLKDQSGQLLDARSADSEGAAGHYTNNGIRGDSVISVSFEEKPRVIDYTPHGNFIEERSLPEPLVNGENYAGSNLELESLTIQADYDLITAPERPLLNSATSQFTLYSLGGQTWKYPSIDPEHSALVGMETTPQGTLLVLERRFASMFQPIIFAVRELSLSSPDEGEARVVREIIHFNSSLGWAIDNFEAIAHHENNYYFVISDDNESLFQKTLLLYFEIIDEGLVPAGL